MRLQGDIATIERIEELVKTKSFYHEVRDGGKQGDYKLFGVKVGSVVYSKKYQVLHGLRGVDIKLWFDYRDKTGAIELNNADFGRLCYAVKDIHKQLAGLELCNAPEADEER